MTDDFKSQLFVYAAVVIAVLALAFVAGVFGVMHPV